MHSTPVKKHVRRRLLALFGEDTVVDDFVSAFLEKSAAFNEGAMVFDTSVSTDKIYILYAGWCYSYILLEDGRRQIVQFILPGDFIGVGQSLFDISGMSVKTLTDCQMFEIPANSLSNIIADKPGLLAAIAKHNARNESFMAEQVARLGSKSAYESMAHLFVELYSRLKAAGQVTKVESFKIPLTQEMLGDALGISTVHVNRTLSRFRAEELLEWDDGYIVFKDLNKLEAIGQFAPAVRITDER